MARQVGREQGRDKKPESDDENDSKLKTHAVSQPRGGTTGSKTDVGPAGLEKIPRDTRKWARGNFKRH